MYIFTTLLIRNEISLSEILTKTYVIYECGTDDLKDQLGITTMKVECIKRKKFERLMYSVEACFCENDFCNCKDCNPAKAPHDLNITEWFWACIILSAFSKNIFGFENGK